MLLTFLSIISLLEFINQENGFSVSFEIGIITFFLFFFRCLVGLLISTLMTYIYQSINISKNEKNQTLINKSTLSFISDK